MAQRKSSQQLLSSQFPLLLKQVQDGSNGEFPFADNLFDIGELNSWYSFTRYLYSTGSTLKRLTSIEIPNFVAMHNFWNEQVNYDTGHPDLGVANYILTSLVKTQWAMLNILHDRQVTVSDSVTDWNTQYKLLMNPGDRPSDWTGNLFETENDWKRFLQDSNYNAEPYGLADWDDKYNPNEGARDEEEIDVMRASLVKNTRQIPEGIPPIPIFYVEGAESIPSFADLGFTGAASTEEDPGTVRLSAGEPLTGAAPTEEMFPNSQLNSCLTALANTIGIPAQYWKRWQMEQYMLAKFLSNLEVQYHPISESLVGVDAFTELSEMEGGLRPGCVLVKNNPKNWNEPRLAAKCFRSGSTQWGQDKSVYAAVGRRWVKVKLSTSERNAFEPEIRPLTGDKSFKDGTFAEVLDQLRNAHPVNPFHNVVKRADYMHLER